MRHAEAYTVLFDGFVRRLCATASRDDSLPLLALHRRRWRSRASDLLVHAARDGAARGRLRAFASGLLGWANGGRAIRAPAEFHARATLRREAPRLCGTARPTADALRGHDNVVPITRLGRRRPGAIPVVLEEQG